MKLKQMHNKTFNEPTRQLPVGILANFLFFMQKFLRAFLPVIILFSIRDRWPFSWLITSIGLILGFILVLVWSYLSYRRFFFYLDTSSHTFIIEKGVLAKSKTVIPLEHIQQVNLDQKFIHKLVQVYSLEIDSAGSSEKEVVIPSISHQVALELKSLLLDYAKSNQESIAQVESLEAPFVVTKQSIGFGSLLKLGLTTNYLQTVGLILAFVATLYDQYFKIVFQDYTEQEVLEMYNVKQYSYGIALYGLAILIILVLLVNVVRVVVKFFNFTIHIHPQNLVINYGLLTTRNVILRPKRIQLLKISQNYFQSKLDILHIKVNQVLSTQADTSRKSLEIPGFSKKENQDFFNLVFPNANLEPLMELKPNFRFLVFRIFAFAFAPSVLGGIIFYESLSVVQVLSFAFSLFLGLALLQYRVFVIRKLTIYDQVVCLSTGLWDVTQTWMDSSKIQKITLSQFPWQEKYDIGSIALVTAGGVLRFQTTSYQDLCLITDTWLRSMEFKDRGWM